jgi:ABC-2 type transport system ATP-binding protein
MEEAEALASRVGIINGGNVVALDPTDQLIEKHGKKNLLVLKNADSKAISILSKAGVDVHSDRSSGDIVVHLNHAHAASDVLQKLSEARVSFGELQLKRSSLEDVFLNLTGEQLEREEKAE